MHFFVSHKKQLLLISCFVLLAVSAGAILSDLFLFNVPMPVPAVFALSALAGVIVYLILFSKKIAERIALSVLFTVFSLLLSVFPACFPYWNAWVFKGYNGTELNYDDSITIKEAEEDLKTAMRYLEKVHPMFRNGLTEEVNTSCRAALERLRGMEKITVNDLRREIQLILSPLHDAHTTTYNNYPGDRYLRIAPQRLGEGCSLYSVNGITSDELVELAKPYSCYETENWISVDCGSLASLDFYGLNSFPISFVWKDAEGNLVTDICTEADFVPVSDYLELYRQAFPKTDEGGFVSYQIDEAASLAILTLTECNYNEEYRSCVNAMFREVREKNIRTVAVDLRGNGGGHSGVANEFVRYLPTDSFTDCPSEQRFGFLTLKDNGYRKNNRYRDLTFEGQVYILTDRNSFSAAKDFAMIIQDNRLGEIIGEAPANSLNGYGDVAYFRLPNTGLFFQISTKKWHRIDASNPNDYIQPDHPCNGADVYSKIRELAGEK